MTARARRTAWWAGIALGIAALAFAVVAAFPWGLLAGHADGMLARALGRPVAIGAARRVDWLSFHPLMELRDVRVGQPAGFGSAPMARIASIRIRFAALPLLIGRFRPQSIELAGARLLLLRDAAGRSNWAGGGKQQGSGGRASLELLTVHDTEARLIDAKRHVRLAARIRLDPAAGLTVAGSGTHRGTPLRLLVRSADPAGGGAVRVRVVSPLARVDGIVTPDRPFDLTRFDARIAAAGTDLSYLDDVLQIGLFPTRPFGLDGRIRRNGAEWRIDRLGGRIGRSSVAADLTVARVQGRTMLRGAVDAGDFDFDDFSSAAQRAHAAARRARIGPRVIPATAIQLDALHDLDGSVRFHARRLLSSEPSAFRSLATTVTLDRQRLTLFPLTAGLRSGTLSGRAVVDDRAGTPRLALDLRIGGARIERLLLPDGTIDGAMLAHVRLGGSGDTVRAALAGASGKIGIAVPGGSMRRDYAVYAGGDLLKSVGTAIGGNTAARTPLRCLVADFAVAGGRMTPRRLVLDTEITRADGTGLISLADEAIALSLHGRAKDPGLIQSTAPVRLVGTLSDPRLDIRPPRAERKGKGGVFERIGFLLKGLRTGKAAERTAAPARADCAGLQRQALR